MAISTRSPSRSRSPSCGPLYPPKTEVRTGQLFRPPKTPGARSDRLHDSFQTPRYAVGTAASSRKRARPDSSSRESALTPYSTATTPWTNVSSSEASILRSDCASPAPFVNTTYNIAGGLDTPTQSTDSYFDRQDVNDLGVTRRWNAPPVVDEPKTTDRIVVLGGDRNGQRRYISSPNGSPAQSWGRFVFTVVGGVTEKIWQLCTAGAFSGFYAGGGKGYDVPTPGGEDEGGLRSSSVWEDVKDSRRSERDATPVPGQYPEEEDEADWSSARPAKRQHTDTGAGWVMISDTGSAMPTPESMSRLSSRRKTATATPTAPRPALVSRRSLVPVSRRSSGITQTISPAIHPKRPTLTPHQQSASDTGAPKSSPLSPEAHKYVAERRREERQADASIRRLNDQLKAMIKEGREALGTKVDIVDDVQMEDEGYFEQR